MVHLMPSSVLTTLIAMAYMDLGMCLPPIFVRPGIPVCLILGTAIPSAVITSRLAQKSSAARISSDAMMTASGRMTETE